VFWTWASLKDAGCLTFAAAKMGGEIIPSILDLIRKATKGEMRIRQVAPSADHFRWQS